MSVSAVSSVFTSVDARPALRVSRRKPRRGSIPVRAAPEDATNVSSKTSSPSSTPKPPPSVIVGGFFVAQADTKNAKRLSTDSDSDRRNTIASSTTSGSARANKMDRLEDRKSKGPSFGDDGESTLDKLQQKTLETTAVTNEAIAMWLGAAVLGPLLDHQHSRFDVLHYFNPMTIDVGGLFLGPDGTLPKLPDGPILSALHQIFQRETGILETAWWVPLLFGGAGVVIGLGHTFGDSLRLKTGAISDTFEGVAKKYFIAKCPGRPVTGWEPSTGTVALAISFFALNYFVSGVFATTADPPFPDLPRVSIDLILGFWGFSCWYGFDRTAQGLFMAGLTAVAGPLAEIGLINVGHLYQYSNPDFLGIPSWIIWVYFCGSPAVGLLARRVRAELRSTLLLPTPVIDVQPPSKKKTWRPPPRGFQAEGLSMDKNGGVEGANRVVDVERTPRGRVTVVLEETDVADLNAAELPSRNSSPSRVSDAMGLVSKEKKPNAKKTLSASSTFSQKLRREELEREVTALQQLKGKLSSLKKSLMRSVGIEDEDR